MKKQILTLAGILVTSTLAFAQPVANSLYFGGQFGVLGLTSGSTSTTIGDTTIDDDPSTFSYTISPSIGYTLTDRILVGVRPVFSGSKTETVNLAGDKETDKESTAGAFIFGRYYFPASERFLFYTNLNIGYFSTTSKTETGGTTTEGPKTNTFVAGVTPGMAYYLNSRWAIELSVGFLGYTSSTTKDDFGSTDIETKTNNFIFSLDVLTVNLGVSYQLPL